MNNGITREDAYRINKNYLKIEDVLTNCGLTVNTDFYQKVLDKISEQNKLKREKEESRQEYEKRLQQYNAGKFQSYLEGYFFAHFESVCPDLCGLDVFTCQRMIGSIIKIVVEICFAEKENEAITEKRIRDKLYQRDCRLRKREKEFAEGGQQ